MDWWFIISQNNLNIFILIYTFIKKNKRYANQKIFKRTN